MVLKAWLAELGSKWLVDGERFLEATVGSRARFSEARMIGMARV